MFLIYLSLYTGYITIAQGLVFDWAKRFGGPAVDMGSAIAVDALGNVYTSGSFHGTVDFDPGIDTFNLTSTGSNIFFISKLDANGNFIWAKNIGGSTIATSQSIGIDALNNIYATGSFSGTADFDPDPTGVFNLTAAGGSDIFICKLDANGNFIWAKQMGGASSDLGISIKTDLSGNIYTIGNFHLTADFDPGPGVFNLTSAGSGDIFVSKLDTGGNFIWAKQMGGTSNDDGHSLALDNSGNIYTTGFFQGTADFDPGPGTFNFSAGAMDIYITKLNPDGNFIWAKQLGGSSFDRGYSIVLDESNNVYTTGFFSLTSDFDPSAGTFNLTSAGGYDIFISKLDSSGSFVWAKRFGAASADQGYSIALDAGNNIYSTGFFNQTVDFDPGIDTFNLTPKLGANVFLSKLDEDGNFIWAKQLGGRFIDQGSSITVDPIGNVYTTGHFYDTADFDPGIEVFNLISNGNVDVFVHKMSICIDSIHSSSILYTECDSLQLNGIWYTTSQIVIDTLSHEAMNGCDSFIINDITILSTPNVEITPSTDTVTLGNSITLISSGATTYQWNDNSTDNQLIISPTSDTIYCVIGSNGICTDTVCAQITVTESSCEGQKLFIPTAISPNSDNINKAFCITNHACIVSLKMSIYDRYGQIVYQTNNKKHCWDGTYEGHALTNDVYIVYLEAILKTSAVIKMKGNILLIR